MKKCFLLISLISSPYESLSQGILMSWSQQNIENYTREMYDEAQKLTSSELLAKNLNDQSWSGVFLTLNASINHHAHDSTYLKDLAQQVVNNTETKLSGTRKLIIWDRILNGDIVFEGKGLVIEDDLFTVAGRANQILRSLTSKNFGVVTIHTTNQELGELKAKWEAFLSGKTVAVFEPAEYKNSKIPEASSLTALQALILSLQDNPKKEEVTKNCLKQVYNLNEMPREKGVPASYCNPDTYTFSYLGMLFGDAKYDRAKDAKWWQNFWVSNHNNLVWSNEKGIYEVRK